MNAALEAAPRCVEIVAGLDESQVEGAYCLHSAWGGESFNRDQWIQQMQGFCRTGRYALVIAWDDDQPVGIGEFHLISDPITGETAQVFERAYVLPEYRKAGVFEAGVTQTMNLGRWLAASPLRVTSQRIPVGVDGQGQGLQRLYARSGFEPVATIMERRL